MKFTVRDIFNTDVDTYWGSIFFEEAYNREMYMDGLKFKRFELLELTGEAGGNRTRKTLTEPPADAPKVVKKLIGNSLAYTEIGSFDASKKLWDYHIVLSKLSEKVTITGKLWAEPKGEKSCERIAEIEIKVSIFGVGGAIEKFIKGTTLESYKDATTFTNDYIKRNNL